MPYERLETIVRSLKAAFLVPIIAVCGCGPNVQDGNGRQIDRQAEREAQALELEAVRAEEPMADGGQTAVIAEEKGAALDREADMLVAGGEREAAASRSR